MIKCAIFCNVYIRVEKVLTDQQVGNHGNKRDTGRCMRILMTMRGVFVNARNLASLQEICKMCMQMMDLHTSKFLLVNFQRSEKLGSKSLIVMNAYLDILGCSWECR